MKNISGKVIEKLILYFDGDARRINHALKVYGFAKTIGEIEGLKAEEQFVLEVASILHDIGIKISEEKYNSSAGPYQELEGPPVAKELLKEFDLSKEIVERICYLIGHHHSYTKIDGIDFQILVEADFLTNIYEDAMDLDRVAIIEEKYFKTTSGKIILNSMYHK